MTADCLLAAAEGVLIGAEDHDAVIAESPRVLVIAAFGVAAAFGALAYDLAVSPVTVDCLRSAA